MIKNLIESFVITVVGVLGVMTISIAILLYPTVVIPALGFLWIWGVVFAVTSE